MEIRSFIYGAALSLLWGFIYLDSVYGANINWRGDARWYPIVGATLLVVALITYVVSSVHRKQS